MDVMFGPIPSGDPEMADPADPEEAVLAVADQTELDLAEVLAVLPG